jgi:hypothetical protein
MSVSLGVYEFFSYILPGVLYLYVGNEALRLLGLPKIDLSRLNNVEAVLLLGIAYLAGHIMNAVCEFLWRYLGRKKMRLRNLPEISLERLKKKFKGINFKKDEWDFLLNRIRQDEPLLSAHLERFKALSLMLRNTALALYIFMGVKIGEYAVNRDLKVLFLAIALGIFGFWAAQRAKVFDIWFYNGIYSEGLRFGKNVEEVLLNNSNVKPKTTRAGRNVSK